MANEKIMLYGPELSTEVSRLTADVCASDDRVSGWLATQHWRWTGGDAIMVLVSIESWCVIRVEDRVQVIKVRSLNAAMRAVGLNPEDFQAV